MKIAIVGSPGSGKSTFAFKLHTVLHIPLFHLDQYFWQPGWQKPDRQEFKKTHQELCDAKEWIIEGMTISLFEYRMRQADIIIFLDVPLYICLYRILKRAFLNVGKVCFSSAPGCPEKFPSWEFLKYVWDFRKIQKPEIEDCLAYYKNEKKIFVVKNKHQLDELIKKLQTKL